MSSKPRLDHVAITVESIERSLGFYRDLLECEVLGQLMLRDGKFKITYLQAGEGRIELFEFAEKGTAMNDVEEDIGFKHIAFVVDDVDAVAAKLKAAGVRFTVEPKVASSGSIRLAFARDPDGNLVELVSGLPSLQPYKPSVVMG